MVEVVYHGHSCVQINTGEVSIVIDPFFTGNPQAVSKPEDIKADYVLLTHAHKDHTGDALAVAQANDATIVAIHELAVYMGWKGAKAIGMNVGGTIDIGPAKVQMVPAIHSSAFIIEEEQKIIYAGTAAGLIVRVDGFTILHAGDTCLFSDMKLIGERNDIDLAFIPIGDVFTMGPEDALTAAEWYKARCVVPVHHSTWDPIAQDAERFVQSLKEKFIDGRSMKPGESMTLSAK
ncbi:metal-dependent hydrolase [Paenibacillus turpanensis]|uniref:metal-dependent hydrolase n=1 Tax=Paenibacillus turpanensis TaxID=2689078 RepID=UPI00140E9656|nr:metal-dependent hydrolase [Paenibacillus turpanensis]